MNKQPLIPSNKEKQQVWDSYISRTPKRVPVRLNTNMRIILLDPLLNTSNLNFEHVFQDPHMMMKAELQHKYHRAMVINHYTDDPVGLPDRWEVGVSWMNVFEAAFFGAPIEFRPGQVPDTHPVLTGNQKEAIFKVDITKPLEQGIFKKGLDYYEAMCSHAEQETFYDRPIQVNRYAHMVSDGPLTVALNLRGAQFLSDLILEPDYADRVMNTIMDAFILRVEAFRTYWGDPTLMPFFADDSIQLIGEQMYIERVLPIHKRFYDTFYPTGHPQQRSIHLCGDVSRLMPALVKHLDIRSWDSGFPMAFGDIRQVLGPEMEIAGGPPVAVLLNRTPEEVYDQTRAILESGIKQGGRFILQEANNLPPRVPEANLQAMYHAALDFGTYEC